MTWADFYLICFVVGLLLSVLALVIGDLHMHLHFPFHIHLGHFDVGAPSAPHAAGGHAGGAELPVLNFGTITAFLAWFGGIGYLLTRHSQLYAFTALGIAIAGGFAGGALIFLLLSKTVMRHEEEYESVNGDMVGVLGRITNSVFEGGTGEIVYVQGGTRHSCAARSEDGVAIPKGTEVIVTRYEKGIAYVRPWEEMADADLGATNVNRNSKEA
jgi:membrane protein implicated in regulation of membrane protease activity